MSNNKWTREELILALDLYYRLPFGRLNRSTPEVIELANLIGRTNNSVALRLVNFAALIDWCALTGINIPTLLVASHMLLSKDKLLHYQNTIGQTKNFLNGTETAYLTNDGKPSKI